MFEPEVAAHNIGVCKNQACSAISPGSTALGVEQSVSNVYKQKHIRQWLAQTELTQKRSSFHAMPRNWATPEDALPGNALLLATGML